MNRRNFIKTAAAASVIPYVMSASVDSGQSNAVVSESVKWPYHVQCYIRQQGEWIFSTYERGSFNYQHEYDMSENGCMGWMDSGKLHFRSIKDSVEFIELHARCINVEAVDVVYDIYHLGEHSEIQCGHFWYDWETGREVSWTSREKTDYSKV